MAIRTQSAIKADTDAQLKQLGKNLLVFREYIRVKGAKVLAVIANDLLAHALPMTPYATGQLRRSGTAYITIKGHNITVGKTDSSPKWNKVDARIPAITANMIKGAKYLKANVSFNRINDSGQDIAVWAHEDLLPWIARPKPESLKGIYVATKEFTGPKYLENALRLRADEYRKVLDGIANAQNIQSDIVAISKVTKRKRFHYEVDVVELVESELANLGINVGDLSYAESFLTSEGNEPT